MATPHIEAEKGAIAEKILLPGDPLRAKFIAETYLTDAVCFNRVRNMLGYTGLYHGERVSVMGTGMGMPSLSIYAHELIHAYGVKNLIRVGSAGAMREDLHLYDLVLAQGACTDSRIAFPYALNGTYSAIASWNLLSRAAKAADAQGKTVHVGNVFSTDVFYNPLNSSEAHWKKWANMGCLAVEMETYALYALAASAGVDALGILTISDSLVSGKETTSEERQNSFHAMMEIALAV